MPSEWERMVAGELYEPQDPELVARRARARDLCLALNNSTTGTGEGRARRLLQELLGTGGDTLGMRPPFFCDYGENIHLGERVFMNFDCVLLDVCEIRIGAYSQLGPGVHIYTALHPMSARARREKEYGVPVTLGRDVWVGGGALILPGVRIGDRAVIGAGSVVTRDIPEGVLAVGNPCRVVREVEP